MSTNMEEIAEAIRQRIIPSRPNIIGMGGPGGSGKTTLAKHLGNCLNAPVLHLDDFRLPRKERPAHAKLGSHPDATDHQDLHLQLSQFQEGKPLTFQAYDPLTGNRCIPQAISPGVTLIVEGEIAAHQHLREKWDLFILLTCPLLSQLKARLQRDTFQSQSLRKVLQVFFVSNILHYPKFSKGATQQADLLVKRDKQYFQRVR